MDRQIDTKHRCVTFDVTLASYHIFHTYMYVCGGWVGGWVGGSNRCVSFGETLGSYHTSKTVYTHTHTHTHTHIIHTYIHTYIQEQLVRHLLRNTSKLSRLLHLDGTQFTCFTGTKVQKVKQNRCLQDGMAKLSEAQFTCFTGAKVQIVVQKYKY